MANKNNITNAEQNAVLAGSTTAVAIQQSKSKYIVISILFLALVCATYYYWNTRNNFFTAIAKPVDSSFASKDTALNNSIQSRSVTIRKTFLGKKGTHNYNQKGTRDHLEIKNVKTNKDINKDNLEVEKTVDEIGRNEPEKTDDRNSSVRRDENNIYTDTVLKEIKSIIVPRVKTREERARLSGRRPDRLAQRAIIEKGVIKSSPPKITIRVYQNNRNVRSSPPKIRIRVPSVSASTSKHIERQ